MSFLIYADDTLFQSAKLAESQTAGGQPSQRVAGSVVSLTVEQVDLFNLSEPIVIEFKVHHMLTVSLDRVWRKCLDLSTEKPIQVSVGAAMPGGQ